MLHLFSRTRLAWGFGVLGCAARMRQCEEYRVSAAPLDLSRPTANWSAHRSRNNPCLHLNKSPLQNWNGLLFSGNRDIAKDLGNVPRVMRDLDFSGYMLDRVEVIEYDFNWKTFIEVYTRIITSFRFTPASATSSTVTTSSGNLASTTACRPWASTTRYAKRAAR